MTKIIAAFAASIFLISIEGHAESIIEKIKISNTASFGSKKVITSKEDENGYSGTITIMTKPIGTIEEGFYKGASLNLAQIVYEVPGPSYGIDEFPPTYQRFIQTKDKIIFLRKASQSTIPWEEPDFKAGKPAGFNSPFVNFDPFPGFKLEYDDTTQIRGFDVPSEIIFDENPRKKIKFAYESDESPFSTENSYLFSEFKNSKVFTLKPEKSNAIDSFFEDQGTNPTIHPKNQFYIQKPDKTFSVYYYEPDIFNGSKISKEFSEDYTHAAWLGCDKNYADQIDIITHKIKGTPKLAGKTFNNDNLYYPEDELLKELHKYYLKTKSDYFNPDATSSSDRSFHEKEIKHKIKEPTDFNEFKKMNPMLLWRNPLNQWVRLVRVRFLKPQTCN